MERKSIYSKGRAGHVRNVSSYRLYMQHVKKWRIPFTAVLVIILVFGVAPVVGEEFQSSLLTAGEINSLADVEPAQAKKVLLNELNSFVDDCARFNMSECKEEGDKLIAEFVNPRFEADARQMVKFVTDFEGKYSKDIAYNACKFDLGNAVLRAKNLQGPIMDFMRKYGAELNSDDFSEASAAFSESLDRLDAFVEFCIRR